MSAQFGIVVSDFNETITTKLLAGAVNRLKERGVPDSHVFVVHVPGAVEIPLTAQMLAKTKKYAAIICLGAVIRGDTDHYDYVCQQVSQGCQQVMLEHELPVIFGILTTNNERQAEERIGGAMGHKGVESADAAIMMVEVMRQVRVI
jgi:6,7-dimethyl-8-ribityllumazine synthase